MRQLRAARLSIAAHRSPHNPRLPHSCSATFLLQSRGDIMRWLSLEEEQAAGRGALAAVMRRMECVRRQLEAQG